MTNEEVTKLVEETKELIKLVGQMWTSDSTHDDVQEKAHEVKELIRTFEDGE